MSGATTSGSSKDKGAPPLPFERKVTPQECDLALLLIKDKLGEVVSRVARVVVTKGQAELGVIIKESGLAAESVKHCLIILVKQNFVRSYMVRSVRTSKKRAANGFGVETGFVKKFIYVADPKYMLALLRFPQWMMMVKESLSTQAEGCLQALITHGRLSRKEVVDSASDILVDHTKGELEKAFATLVREQFVERAPSVLLPPPWHRILQDSVKRGHKGLKDDFTAIPKFQDFAEFEYAETKRNRFNLENGSAAVQMNGSSGKDDKADVKAAAMNGNGTPSGRRGQGRKRRDEVAVKAEPKASKRIKKGRGGAAKEVEVVSEDDGAGGATDDNGNGLGDSLGDIQWRVNAQELSDRFKEEYCLRKVQEGLCLPKDVATFTAIVLAYRKRRHEKDENKNLLTLNEIYHAMQGARRRFGKAGASGAASFQGIAQKGAAKSAIKESLESLERHPLVQIITLRGHNIKSGEAEYVLNLDRLWKELQLSHVDRVVEQKFSKEARRVFRLLRGAPCMDEININTKAMLQVKTTRSILYDLFRVGYVHMYDVPRDNTYNPSRTYYLWHIDVDLLLHRCRADFYGSMHKIQEIYARELEGAKPLLESLSEIQSKANAGKTAEERQRIKNQEVAALMVAQPDFQENLSFLQKMQDYLLGALDEFDQCAILFTI